MSAQVQVHARQFAAATADRIAILELVNQAQGAVMAGVRPGDMRWSHPARDFYWHDTSGRPVFMDAYQFISLARRVMEHGEERRLRRRCTTACLPTIEPSQTQPNPSAE